MVMLYVFPFDSIPAESLKCILMHSFHHTINCKAMNLYIDIPVRKEEVRNEQI